MNLTTSGSERQRLTCLLAVNAMPPELAVMEDTELSVNMSPNAWITQESFLDWIARIWRPYSAQLKRCLIIMDRYPVR